MSKRKRAENGSLNYRRHDNQESIEPGSGRVSSYQDEEFLASPVQIQHKRNHSTHIRQSFNSNGQKDTQVNIEQQQRQAHIAMLPQRLLPPGYAEKMLAKTAQQRPMSHQSSPSKPHSRVNKSINLIKPPIVSSSTTSTKKKNMANLTFNIIL